MHLQYTRNNLTSSNNNNCNSLYNRTYLAQFEALYDFDDTISSPKNWVNDTIYSIQGNASNIATFIALPVRERRRYLQYKAKYILRTFAAIEDVEAQTIKSCFNAFSDDPNFVSCMILNILILPSKDVGKPRSERDISSNSIGVTFTFTFKEIESYKNLIEVLPVMSS